jgi:hypothetical protein
MSRAVALLAGVSGGGNATVLPMGRGTIHHLASQTPDRFALWMIDDQFRRLRRAKRLDRRRLSRLPSMSMFEIAASALAQYLSRQEHGIEQIRDMIVHDIRQAQQGQDKQHIVVLLPVLHHFLKAHPEQHPWSRLY